MPTSIKVTTATKAGKPQVKITLDNGTQAQITPEDARSLAYHLNKAAGPAGKQGLVKLKITGL